MRSADITFNSSPVTSNAPASHSTSASTSASSEPASRSSSDSNPPSTHVNKKSTGNTASNNKATKHRDEISAKDKSDDTTAAAKDKSVDTGKNKDFLTTLATLLDEGTTPPVTTNAVSVATPTNDSRKEETPTDPQAAIDVMLLGVGLGSNATVTTATTTTTGNHATAVDTSGLMQSVLGKNNADTSANAAGITLGLNAGADALSIDSQKDKLDSVDNTQTANSALSAATDNRVNTAQEAREQGTLDARVGTAKWTDELAARVSLLSQRDLHVASLKLSPEHLGPLEIQISVQNDKTSVWFGATHAETRAALEQALPRLRELLSSQGLTLTDSGVFREPPRDQMRGYQAPQIGNSSDATRQEVDVRVKVNRSLLDTYA
jgi:flagellar hook-length control protein FliK